MRRRKARALALQALYEYDCVKHEPLEVLHRLAREFQIPEDLLAFAEKLVRGVVENKEKLDAVIREFAPLRPVEDLPPIDRNILRIAIFEIMEGEVPLKVAIDEAVGLAKTFGSESSYRFVNGVLGSYVRYLEKERIKADML